MSDFWLGARCEGSLPFPDGSEWFEDRLELRRLESSSMSCRIWFWTEGDAWFTFCVMPSVSNMW